MNDRTRPDGGGIRDAGGRSETQHIALMPRAEWEMWLDGYGVGYVHGIDRGRQLADDEAAILHRAAHKVVHAVAKLEPHQVREQRRREDQVESA